MNMRCEACSVSSCIVLRSILISTPVTGGSAVMFALLDDNDQLPALLLVVDMTSRKVSHVCGTVGLRCNTSSEMSLLPFGVVSAIHPVLMLRVPS